jgi:hypothetical protein
VIDIKRLRQDPDGTRAALARRLDPSAINSIDRILDLDRQRREILVRVETLKAERNAATEEVAKRKRAGAPADDLLASLKVSADAVKVLDAELRDVDEALEPELLTVPNILLADVPDGDATQNRITRTWGEVPRFDFTPKPHWELGEALGILDLANGAKVAGSGFPILRGMGRQAGARAGQLHARPAHHGARLRGSGAAVPGEQGVDAGHRTAAEVRRRALHRHGGWPVPHSHERSPAHQHLSRHDPGRDGAAGGGVRLDTLLPPRGGRGRQGHARADPGAPVRQGGAGAPLPSRGHRGAA